LVYFITRELTFVGKLFCISRNWSVLFTSIQLFNQVQHVLHALKVVD